MLRALWSLLVGLRGILKGSWGVLAALYPHSTQRPLVPSNPQTTADSTPQAIAPQPALSSLRFQNLQPQYSSLAPTTSSVHQPAVPCATINIQDSRAILRMGIGFYIGILFRAQGSYTGSMFVGLARNGDVNLYTLSYNDPEPAHDDPKPTQELLRQPYAL